MFLVKKGLIIAAVAFSAIVLAVLVVPSFFDWNTQKERIETVATDALGQPVKLQGDVGLSLLPTPRLTAEGLTVGARDTLAQGPYISAGLIDVRVAFFPLLSGKIEAGKVILRDAEIVLLTGQEQALDDKQTQDAADTSTTRTPDVGLPSAQIQNAKITLIDAATGNETKVSQIDLDVTAQSVTGPFSAEGSLRYGSLPIDLSVQTGDIAGEDFPFEMRFTAKEAADMSLVVTGSAGSLLTDAPRVDAALDIQTSDAGRALEAISGSANPALNGKALSASSPLSFESGTLYMADLKLNFDTLVMSGEVAARTQAQPLKVTAKLVSGKLDASRFLAPVDPDAPLLDPIEIELPADLDAVVTVEIDSLTGMPGAPVELSRVQFTTRLNAGKLDITQASALLPGGVSAAGRASFQSSNGILIGSIRAETKGANAQPLMLQLLGDDAAMPAGPTPIDLTIDAFLEPSGLRLGAMVGQLGPMQVSASGKLDYGPKPTIDVRANVNDITLDDWISQTPSQPPAQGSDGAFDGDIKFDLSVERLRRAGQIFEGLKLQGALKDDRLTLKSARLGDAKSALIEVTGGVANATSEAPQLDLQFKAQASSANALLALGGTVPVELAQNAGRLDLTGFVKGSTRAPQLAAKGTLGALTLDTTATIQDLDTSAPTTTASAVITVPSLAAWLNDIDMAEETAVGNAAQPVTLVTAVKSTARKTSATVDIKNAKGLAKVVYGQEGDAYDIDIGASAASITEYIRALGFAFDPAGARLGGLDVAIRMSGPLNALTLNTLKADVGPAKLTGTGKLDLSGDVSLVNLRLMGKNLDLADLLPEANTGAQAVASGSGARWSKDPLDLSVLESVDGAITLDLDRLTLREYELKDARLSMGSEGKSLKIALERGTLFNGPATLSMALEAASMPKMSVDVAIKNGDIATATQSSAAIEPLTGTFDLSGSFSGSGASEYAIVQSLQGEGAFTARDGVINGVNIVQLNERFGSLSTVNDFLRIIGSALKGGQTAYRLIAVDTVASKGILTTRNMRTDIDGGAKASLNARIDLPAWQIKAAGAFSLEDHPDAPPVGVSITGPLDNSVVTYETKKIQEYIGVRLGAAVLKGVVKGEGFGLKDLLGGGSQNQESTDESSAATDAATDSATDWSAPSNAADTGSTTPENTATKKKPEEEIRDLILEGLFGRKNRD